MATHFNTQRIHLSRDLLLSDILIFVKIIKEMILLCVALWNASAKGTCNCEYEIGTSVVVWVVNVTRSAKTGLMFL